jgi:transcription elongation GreA/GreB family factor
MSSIQMTAIDPGSVGPEVDELESAGASGIAAAEVSFGSTVSFVDQRDGRDQKFKIVSSYDAKPQEGTLSIGSPVAGALLHHKAGDLVEVATPRGKRPLLITAVD